MKANILQKLIGKENIRKYNKTLVNLRSFNIKEDVDMTKRAKVLTLDEFKKAINYCATTRYQLRNSCLLMMSFYGGLRVGEISALQYKDVIDSDGLVKTEFYLTADKTKGDEGRNIYVNKKLQKSLQAYAFTYPPKTKNNNDPLFFSQQSNNGYSANTLTQWFHHFYKNLGIQGASSHSGRRSFVTSLADKGINVKVIAELVGHKNISTTQKYIEVNDTMLKRAVELV
mgnify:FL=1|jgi:integrase/recombinase XerD